LPAILPDRVHALLPCNAGIEQKTKVGDLIVLCEIGGERVVQIHEIQQMVEGGKLRSFCDLKEAQRRVAEYLAKGIVQ
jgi:hypothetical protein